MAYLTVHETPPVKTPYLLTTFKGWPDAGEGASGAIKYLIRKLGARKFAELDPEEFYDFTEVRPHTSLSRQGLRQVRWPSNELYYWAAEEPSRSMMFFLGVEPNLKWRTFTNSILDAARGSGVETVVHVGSLLDAVPHTRGVRLTGSSNGPDLKSTMERHLIASSNYQGPTGITSAVMEGCTARSMSYATMWGHTPHYLQAAPNYRVSYALVSALCRLLDLTAPLDELASAAETFDQEVDKAVTKDSQIGSYVRKLEERYDETTTMAEGSILQSEDLVKELEEFLKEQQRRNGGEAPDE